MTWPSVTVAVLTWNGETYLDALLTAVETQDYPGEVEVLVIDSGSTDGTLGILARHPRVRLHEIPNTEFGHGRTRDLAARLATGDVVAYLTHDAVPMSNRWLRELVLPLADDERIAAVVGRQVARPGAPPAVKYDIRRVFDRLGPLTGITVTWDAGSGWTDGELALAAFHSDVNGAARRDVLTGSVPYRDVDYAEDQLLGRDLLAAGWRKAYAPRAVVEHSNDTTLRTFGDRVAADVRGMRMSGAPVAPLGRIGAFLRWVRWSAADAVDILGDPEYGVGRKIRWLLVNPWYQAVKWSAYARASRERAPGSSAGTP